MLSWLVTPRGSCLSVQLRRHLSTRVSSLTGSLPTLFNFSEDPHLHREGSSVDADALFDKQSLADSLVQCFTEVSSVQRERIKWICVIAQTDSSKAYDADGAGKGNFHHVYMFVDSSEGKVRSPAAAVSLLESGHSCFCKHSKLPFTHFMGLRKVNSRCVQADHSTPIGRLRSNQAMPAGRLQISFCKANLTYWNRMRAFPELSGMNDLQTSCLQSSRGCSSCCDASLLTCKSLEVLPLKARRKSAEHEGDHPRTSDGNLSRKTSKKDILPLDDFADMLFSAVTHPDVEDIGHIQSQVRLRFRRTPSENFLSDLQQKVEYLMLQSPKLSVVKTLLIKKSFLFASLKQLQAPLRVLKSFFGSGEKACSTLARSAFIIVTPLERIQKMLNLIVEFQIEKRACEHGKLLTLDAEKARNVLTFLTDWGVTSQCRSLMVYKDMRCLIWSVDEHIRPVLDFLESTGMSKPEIVKLLGVKPDILRRSVASNLMFKHDICEKMGLNFALAIHYTTYHSSERFLSQFEFFRKQGFSDEAIVELVEREPRILSKSMQDLKLKLDYLLCVHTRDVDEIVRFPASLCYSFKCRIVPRITVLKEKGMLDSVTLAYVLSMTSAKFRKVFKVDESVMLT